VGFSGMKGKKESGQVIFSPNWGGGERKRRVVAAAISLTWRGGIAEVCLWENKNLGHRPPPSGWLGGR